MQPISRRGFLKLFGAAAPAAILAPKYFFAPVGGWHSDTIINPNAPGKPDVLFYDLNDPKGPEYFTNAIFMTSPFMAAFAKYHKSDHKMIDALVTVTEEQGRAMAAATVWKPSAKYEVADRIIDARRRR